MEPVFANLRHNKGVARFTLRGRAKVEGQWKRFCLVHNIEMAPRLLPDASKRVSYTLNA